MTLFQLVKITLDVLYGDACREFADKTDDEIMSRLKYFSKSYGDLTNIDRKPVDYKDPAARFAYVYKYVAAHGDYIVRILKLAKGALGTVFRNENVRISCIGGGPGSDIVAVLKFLADHGADEPVRKITCYTLDKEQAWADTWTEVDAQLKNDRVQLNVNFQPLDVTDPASWSSQKKFLDADLFTLSYFVSEVAALDDGAVADFWARLFQSARPGALFLYDDNGNDAFNHYFDQQWRKAGLELIASETNVRWTPSHGEQAAELAAYRATFGESPKLQGFLSYRILRKP